MFKTRIIIKHFLGKILCTVKLSNTDLIFKILTTKESCQEIKMLFLFFVNVLLIIHKL